MLRKSIVALGLVLLISLIPGARAVEEDGGNQGTWQLVTGELAGQKFPDEVAKGIQLVIKDGKYTVTVAKEGSDKGTVKLNASAKPKELDITGIEGPNKGKTFLAIYERHGDTLRVCYDLSGKSRPKEFKTKPKTQLFLAVYKLEKP